jgi:hypothetical protein
MQILQNLWTKIRYAESALPTLLIYAICHWQYHDTKAIKASGWALLIFLLILLLWQPQFFYYGKLQVDPTRFLSFLYFFYYFHYFSVKFNHCRVPAWVSASAPSSWEHLRAGTNPWPMHRGLADKWPAGQAWALEAVHWPGNWINRRGTEGCLNKMGCTRTVILYSLFFWFSLLYSLLLMSWPSSWFDLAVVTPTYHVDDSVCYIKLRDQPENSCCCIWNPVPMVNPCMYMYIHHDGTYVHIPYIVVHIHMYMVHTFQSIYTYVHKTYMHSIQV